jgi:hypothetical protein
MDRIKGKFIPPLHRPAPDGEGKADELARSPAPGPSSSRLVAPGSSLAPLQREQNRQLIALYHAMRDIEGSKLVREALADPASSIIKGWKKRGPRKAPAKSRDGRAKRKDADGEDERSGEDGEQKQ